MGTLDKGFGRPATSWESNTDSLDVLAEHYTPGWGLVTTAPRYSPLQDLDGLARLISQERSDHRAQVVHPSHILACRLPDR
jgi:hypothetical protein